MKKLLLCLGLAALPPPPLFAFHGLYVGGSLGGHLAEETQTGSTASTEEGSTGDTAYRPLDLPKNMFDHGVQGMLYAGYGVRWNSLYLAGEAFTQFNSANLQSSQQIDELYSSTKTSLNTFQFGFDLLPGWVVTPQTLLYARVGISCARASLFTNSVNAGASDTDTWSLPMKLSQDETFAALRLGAGLEQRLTKRVSFRADYIFTDYGSLSAGGSLSGLTTPSDLPITVSSMTNVHVYDQAFMLSLSYRLFSSCPTTCNGCSYFGGSIGGGTLEATNSGGSSGTITLLGGNTLTQTSAEEAQLYNHQFQGMLFLGYGRSWKRLYLGGELIATGISNSTLNCTGETQIISFTDNYSTSYSTSIVCSSWQGGFDFRPGVLVTPFTLFYGRVGVAAAHLKSHSQALSTGELTSGGSIIWNLPGESAASTWQPVLRLGLGIEQQLFSKLHLRADYMFSNYGIISFNDTNTNLDNHGNPVTLNNTLSSHLQNNAFTIGFAYYFH